MKKVFLLAIGFLLTLTTLSLSQSANIKNWANELEGAELFMKVDVVKVQYILGGTDATNIYPRGVVSYRATVGSRQTQSENAEDFAEEVRVRSAKEDSPPQVRVLNRGSAIRIKKLKVRDDEIKVEFDEIGGSGHALRLKFDGKNYSLDEAEDLFWTAFAENEAELFGADQTIQLQSGMSVAEVKENIGLPEIQVNLSDKIVLVYPNMKLVFLNDQLVDVQ